jgi:hypothetical protein
VCGEDECTQKKSGNKFEMGAVIRETNGLQRGDARKEAKVIGKHMNGRNLSAGGSAGRGD